MKHRYSGMVFGMLWWWNLICVFAQPSPVYFDHLTIDQGLSQNTVLSIYKDHLGFIWICTSDGLNRFDGYGFTVYRHTPEDSSSISSNKTYSIREDRDGNLWIGTQNGLNLYSREFDRFTRFYNKPGDPGSLRSNFIRTIYQDKAGVLWIGSMGGGLHRWDEKNRKFIYYPTDDKNVSSIHEDSKGRFWVATNSLGINLINREDRTFRFISFTPILQKSEKTGNSGKKIVEDERNNLWISTEGEGAYCFNPGTGNIESYLFTSGPPASIGSNIVQDIFIDPQFNVWFATDGAGISVLDSKTKKFSSLQYDPQKVSSLSSNAVYDFFEDDQNILWIGTFAGGVNIYNPNRKQFLRYTQEGNNPQGLSHKSVLSFCEDHTGIVWIGTDGGGLNGFDRERQVFKRYLHQAGNPGSLSANAVTVIHQDRKKRIWVGTFAGGLSLFNPQSGTFRNFRKKPDDANSLGNNNVWKILEDRSGRLWIGTLGGLERMDPERMTFTHIPPREIHGKLFPSKVTALYEDPTGMIWVGGTGIALLNPATDQYEPLEDDSAKAVILDNFDVRCIMGDKKGRVWIGTEGGGLFCYQSSQRSLSSISSADGLPNDAIHQIIEDHNGYLWLSTNRGICRFHPDKKEFRNYDRSDGLQSNQFSYSASLLDSKGFIWFGGVNGFNLFQPDSIRDNLVEPPVYITGFTLFNRPVPIAEKNSPLKKHITMTQSIELPYKSVFTFEFTALNYTASEKNQYKYRMIGFDDWNLAENRRNATYTNLNPGTYKFKVIASNNDGKWNKEGAIVEVTILPPWWKTGWAFLGYVVVIMGLLLSFRSYLIGRQRLMHNLQIKDLEKAKIEEVNGIKLRFFTNISHEFRTPLTLILGPLEKLISSGSLDEGIKAQLQMMHRNATRLLRLINQIMEFRKLETGNMKLKVSQGNIVSFLQDICVAFQEFSNRHKISFMVVSEQKEILTWFDKDKLDKIVYNILSNAFKFTPDGGRVELRISSMDPSQLSSELAIQFPQGYVEISVTDTGVGISEEHLEKVFDRFYQVNRKDRSENPHHVEGTGIGLALTRDLIEMHKGKITLRSKAGEGSTFTVILPLGNEQFSKDQRIDDDTEQIPQHDRKEIINSMSPALEEENMDISPGVQPRMLVLIVDDNPDLRQFVRNNLEPEYSVIEAENGEIGWSMIERHQPDLVISDIMMPVLDGVQLCQRIKHNNLTTHIPVILLTAKSSDEAKAEGYMTGADDYISKPFNTSLLLLRIRNLLNVRRRLWEKFRKDQLMQPCEVDVENPDELFLKRAMEVVEKHISDPEFDVKAFVSEMGLSRSVLYRRLEATTGQSVNEFMRIIRLKRAAQILSQNKKTISEVSYEVGFNDPQYFSKCFHKYIGKTPSDYAAGFRKTDESQSE